MYEYNLYRKCDRRGGKYAVTFIILLIYMKLVMVILNQAKLNKYGLYFDQKKYLIGCLYKSLLMSGSTTATCLELNHT